jgi:DNA-binding transcriptional LysR family regulator
MLNPRQIEAFRTVIVMGGVTAAAKALNVTQPAVTRLIQDLQYALGLALFVRKGTRLVPTSEALSLYREVERQFVGLERIEGAARTLREGRSGQLRIAALPTFDIGFAQAPLDFPAIEIDWLPAVRSVAVVPHGHRLAAKPVLGPADFDGEPFISLEHSTPTGYRIEALFAAAGVKRLTRVETPLSMIACGLVASGAGIAIVDPFTAAEYNGRGVVVRPFEPALHYEIGVVWSEGRARSAAALDFAAAVKAAVEHFGR